MRAERIPEYGDKSGSGLDEPSGGQAGLSEQSHAVSFSKCSRLFLEVKCCANSIGTNQRERILLMFIPVRQSPRSLKLT